MSWLTHRGNTIALAIVTAAFLFGLATSMFDVTVETKLFGISLGMLLGIGQAYIAFALWKRYL